MKRGEKEKVYEEGKKTLREVGNRKGRHCKRNRRKKKRQERGE
jgi:hypothetical protein